MSRTLETTAKSAARAVRVASAVSTGTANTVVAHDLLDHAVNAVVETLEGRQLMAGDSSFVTALPFQLEFDQPSGGMLDKNGNGTGFTWVQPNKLGNEYQPQNINLNTATGILYLTTTGTSTAGGPYDGDNTLTNGLQTQFNASTGAFTIRTRLVGPLGYIDAPSEQGGILFGPDQDNYVKLVAVAQPGGTFLQFIDETKPGSSFVHQISSSASLTNIGSFANIQTLDLELVGDASTGKLQAFYRVNGGALTKLSQEITYSGSTKANFFNATARAGIIAMHKNDAGAITVGFDRFEILAGSPSSNRPSITGARPGPGQTGVARDTFIATDVKLPTPGAGVDAATLTDATVKLYRTSDHALVSAHLNTTGGGDAIVLQPTVLLDANTSYTFEINDGVKDTSGAAFVPFVMTFTTGTATAQGDSRIAFEKLQLTTPTGTQYTALTIGPDGKLYGATTTGAIHRFAIKSDGMLGAAEIINTVTQNNGGNRFITGIVFDPASTANNLVMYVSHNYYALENAPDWTGMISRLSGANLGTYQDYITGLPRAIRDHMTNQMAFGPDGKLYISQGSIGAMGAPDNAWGLRSEHLLNAAILQLDTAAIASRISAGQGALNVRTEAVANPYNPWASNAALKIYATGVRNAYDLVWHSNGHLYAPTNGSAAGGTTPTYGGGTYTGTRIDDGVNGPYNIPPIKGTTNVPQTEDDFLHDVVQGGYYGHPNPSRGEFVQDGGNPTAGVDYEEFTSYPVGTQPDRNYRGAAFVFGKNYSPNGVIEYKSDAFGGLLKGKLLVVRYSGGDDIVAIDVNGDGSISGMQSGINGLSGLVDPLDLTADAATGNIYVSEYGASKITLLRPTAPGAKATAPKTTYYFNDVRGGAASTAQKVTIKNTGTATLDLSSASFTGTNASMFQLGTPSGVPATLKPGESATVLVQFNAPSTTTAGIKTATLVVNSNDPNNPSLNINLRGLATVGTGGQNEPSLQRVLDLFQLGVNVGDVDASNTNLFSNAQPLNSINDEVYVQRLIKAGAGNVTIEPLATFAGGSPAVRFGYYNTATPGNRNEVLTLAGGSDAQSVNPIVASGSTTFDPGAKAFGLYFQFPVLKTLQYSEDALNTTEQTVANRRKVRFYALKDANGNVVPNAYIFTSEDFNNDTGGAYDTQDFVGIIRNVAIAPAGGQVSLENTDNVPFPDRMIFNRIQVQPPDIRMDFNPATGKYDIPTQPPNNVVHDTSVMRIRNTGNAPLTINSIAVTSGWQLVNPPAAGTQIAAGGFLDVTVQFVAQGKQVANSVETIDPKTSNNGGSWQGTLTINTDDVDDPTTAVQLAGWWQLKSEQNNEPSLPTMVNKLFGYKTTILNGGQAFGQGTLNGQIATAGEEVLSKYWVRADTNYPVTVRQLAAYHSQGNTAAVRWMVKGATSSTTIFTQQGVEGQTFLPHTTASGNPIAQGTFTPTTSASNPAGAFGWNIDGEKSDDSLNAKVDTNPQDQGHHVRFFPARDASGKVIPNTWLMAMDYLGINYDYQDNLYLVTNMRPENPTAPTDPTVVSGPGVSLTWTPSSSPTASGYNVYRSDSATGTYALVNAAPVTAAGYVDFATVPGQTYYYKISTVDSWGGESAQTAAVSGTRAPDADAPAGPTGVVATSTPDGVMLNWNGNTESDLLGYRVYRSLAADGVFTALNGGATMGVTQLLDNSAVEGTTYYYKISAVDTAGNESVMSVAVSGTRTPPPDTTAPDAPQGVAGAGTKTGNLITWTANAESDLAGYRVFRATTMNGNYTLLNTSSLVASNSFTDTTAATVATYYYRIVAVDKAGNASIASASVSANRPFPDPVRVNAAGGTFVDSQGRTWAADNGFVGGTASNGAYDVLGTTDDPLYTARRYGNFNYNLAVPDGAYKVNLHFADPSFTTPGKRKFDVFAENKQILDDFDIAANGGGKTAIVKGFNVNVTGGELNLKFANVLDNAIVSAIEILPIGDTVAPAVPRAASAVGRQDGIKLDWADNLESDLAGYNVYRSDSVDGEYTKINTGGVLTTSEYLDATAAANDTSYYRVTAVDIYGNESSPVSLTGDRPADTTPPAGVTNLAATGSQAAGIALTWTANTEADLAGYNIYRQDTSSGAFVKLNAATVKSATYTDSTAAYDATSVYRVTAVDTAGNESAFAETNAYRPAAPQNGLKAEYFDDANLTTPSFTRVDANVNFDWGQGAPDASMGVDTFSVRWSGQIQAATTGTYTFTLRSDDGVRMWVNGVLVIDKFVNAGSNKDNVSTGVKLTAGQKVDIKIEYFENTGGAFCQLYWQSSTMAKQLVPTSALFAPTN